MGKGFSLPRQVYHGFSSPGSPWAHGPHNQRQRLHKHPILWRILGLPLFHFLHRITNEKDERPSLPRRAAVLAGMSHHTVSNLKPNQETDCLELKFQTLKRTPSPNAAIVIPFISSLLRRLIAAAVDCSVSCTSCTFLPSCPLDPCSIATTQRRKNSAKNASARIARLKPCCAAKRTSD